MRKKIKTQFDRNPFIVVLLFVLVFLSIPLAEEVFLSMTHPWQRLRMPPSRASRFLGTGEEIGNDLHIVSDENGQSVIQGDLYIQAEDGQLYYYELYDHTWRPAQPIQDYQGESCVNSNPLWGRRQGECLQWENSGTTYYFLLDPNGAIWFRKTTPLFPSYSFCAMSGLLFSILFIMARMFKNRKIQAPIDLTS